MSRIGFLLTLLLLTPPSAPAQREQQSRPGQRDEYEQKFFDQLRRVFGRFRDADLRDVFEMAGPIQCSELINDKGEWREVAFFNEDRKLGDWYRRSIEEVKIDPSVYTFGGPCVGDHGAVQLGTRFPVDESVEAYRRGRIRFQDIVMNVNAPVRAVYDSRTQAYTFDLPYLYLVRRQGNQSVYSLNPPTITDRRHYATEVTDRWDCKHVVADDVTYQFLICRTMTESVGARDRSLPFGASAYFILSDGKEASSSVRLVFGDDPVSSEPPARSETAPTVGDRPAPKPATADDRAVADNRRGFPDDIDAAAKEGWQVPGATSKLVEVGKDEFRIRFSAQTWAGRIQSAQMLVDQKLSSAESTKPPAGMDYCAWRPGSASSFDRLLAKDPDDYVAYSVKGADKERQTDASVSFELKTHTGFRLGVLQCYFPKTELAASVPFSRWVSIVGAHLTLEDRP